jgi:hypothetical protein
MLRRVAFTASQRDFTIMRISLDQHSGHDLASGESAPQQLHMAVESIFFVSTGKNICFVVIELKNVRAGAMAFAQVHGYMGWVAERLAGNDQ